MMSCWEIMNLRRRPIVTQNAHLRGFKQILYWHRFLGGIMKNGSFVSLVKSVMLRYAKYGIGRFGGGLFPAIV